MRRSNRVANQRHEHVGYMVKGPDGPRVIDAQGRPLHGTPNPDGSVSLVDELGEDARPLPGDAPWLVSLDDDGRVVVHEP